MKTAKILLILAITASFVSCSKKDVLPENFKTGLALACLPQYAGIDPATQSPYQNLVFADEFNGKEPGDDPSCFTRAPNCRVRLDHFKTGSCLPDFNAGATLGELNRCNWNVWSGFSFWDTTNQSAFHPSLVNVSSGTLKLKARYRFDRATPHCGINPNQSSDPTNENYYQRECKIELGGVDSAPGNPITRGRTFQDGRIEIRAKLPGKVGSGPAIWSWPVLLNEGYPYSRDVWNGYQVGEHDLLETHTRTPGVVEGFSTFHDWGPPAGKHISQSSKSYNLPSDTWIRFGLERGLDRDGSTRIVRMYVNDGKTSCVVKEIRQGQDGFELSNWPSFLILQMAAESWWGPLSNVDGATLEVDYVRMYER